MVGAGIQDLTASVFVALYINMHVSCRTDAGMNYNSHAHNIKTVSASNTTEYAICVCCTIYSFLFLYFVVSLIIESSYFGKRLGNM